MLSTSSPILLHIEAVGSDANGLYVDVSARWVLPSATVRSCTTTQLPLSAVLMIMFLFLPSSCRVRSSFLVRLGLGGLTSGSSSSMALM